MRLSQISRRNDRQGNGENYGEKQPSGPLLIWRSCRESAERTLVSSSPHKSGNKKAIVMRDMRTQASSLLQAM